LFTAVEAERAIPGADDAYERALSRLMQDREIRAVPYRGRWQALKYPWHTLDVMDMLLERWTQGLESPGPDYEQREDGVFIGRDVRIFPGAYVVGPALIGHNSVIGHNALVRGSIVGPRCVVGFGSEVARSYLAAGVELHHNYVGDSVLDRDTGMGYGAVTANYRLDGRTVPMFAGNERIDTGRMKLGVALGAGARLGVNASTMPGVRVGAGAIIGPNLRVTRDVPEGTRFLNEGEYGRL
jgi:UDP-N-acetylglucosamine diphosphorylase / glucose-1-phosphate thymidylyltransferase / UDP-N-acetylgalactosamine diphosphorylase / glucosamine-1-phosphate N-acetyltransferase / galactosamine-1-phosphate N-acetyltransferase